MFSSECRERMRLGKYSKWALDLTEEQFEAIIWMIGELGFRFFYVLPKLDNCWNEEGPGRAAMAATSLFRAFAGDRPTLDDYQHRVIDFLAIVRGYAEGELANRPAHHWPIVWQKKLVGWLGNPSCDFRIHYTGTFIPHQDHAPTFLSALRHHTTDGLPVHIAGISTRITSLPDSAGQLNVFMYIR